MSEMTGTEPDVTEILAADHASMLELLGQIHQTDDPAARRDLLDTVIAEVMRHSVAEEMYVYPAMEEHLPDGPDEVGHDKEEHDEIVKLMKQMEATDAASPAFLEQVRSLEQQLQHHAGDEEQDQFPKLRAHLTRDQLVELGQKVEKAKKAAPTRPHPSAPHSALFHKTAGLGVGMVDRLRDKLTGRNTD